MAACKGGGLYSVCAVCAVCSVCSVGLSWPTCDEEREAILLGENENDGDVDVNVDDLRRRDAQPAGMVCAT